MKVSWKKRSQKNKIKRYKAKQFEGKLTELHSVREKLVGRNLLEKRSEESKPQ